MSEKEHKKTGSASTKQGEERKEDTPEGKKTKAKAFESLTESKKPKTKQFLILIGIIIILFLAIIVIPQYLKKAEFESNKYNGFDFVEQDDGLWYTMVQKGVQPYWIPFYYHPKDLEDIPVDSNIKGKFFEMRDNNGTIFITLDPDAGDNNVVIAGVEISRITGSRYDLLNVPTRSAFIKPPSSGSAETETPIVTCADSNNKTLVVWLTLSHSNIAYSYDYCVRLEAKDYKEMIKVADRTMYQLLGIMD